jgi:hypothetical protein
MKKLNRKCAVLKGFVVSMVTIYDSITIVCF